ncbi:MAG: DNA helicase RecG, partial [Verrucomicrobiia bacterium]
AVLESTVDGFAVAEADFRMRGPGDVLGTAQSGLPPLRVADLLRDGEVLAEAKRWAAAVVEGDPELREYPGLRRQVERWLGEGMMRAS